MGRRARGGWLVWAWLVCCVPGAARVQGAGYLIQAIYQDHRLDGWAFRVPIRVRADMAALDVSAFSGQRESLIYRRDQRKLWHVRHETERYVEFDEAALSSVRGAVDATAAFIGRHWTRLTESGEGSAKASGTDVRVTCAGQSRPIGSWVGHLALVTRHDELLQHVWYVPWEEAGVEASDLGGLVELGRFYERMWSMPGLDTWTGELIRVPLGGVFGVPGYPVLIETFAQGRPELTIRLGRPERASLTESSFMVPAGYRRVLF